MKTLCTLLTCAAALAMGVASASANTTTAARVSAPDALTCVFGGPVYVLGHQVVGAFQICVPTP
jgi:hypothetical protein